MEVAQLWPLSRSMRVKWRRCQNIASEMTIHLASPKSWHGRQVESRNLLIPTLQMRGLSWQQTAARHIAYPKDILAVPPYYQQCPTQIAPDDTENIGGKRSRYVSGCRWNVRIKNNFSVPASTSPLRYYTNGFRTRDLALEQLLRIPIYTHVILKSTENNSIVKNTKISQANY